MQQRDNSPEALIEDNSQEAGDDYSSLLDDSADLGHDPEAMDTEEVDAADENPDEEDSGESDGQDAESISDEAKVKLDGRDVSVRELKETFSTFQRKAQEYAETDKVREVQAREAIATIQERAAEQIATLAQGINDLVLPGVDMNMLSRLRLEDPAKAGELLTNLQIVERWKTDMMGKAGEIWKQAQAQREEAGRKQQQATMELLQTESAKLADKKWFNDDFKNRARTFLKSHGIPEQVIGQLSYAGAMEIINKAMAYDKAKATMKQGKQPNQALKQVPASGKQREATGKQRAEAAFSQAKKSGSRKDTARAYSSLLGG